MRNAESQYEVVPPDANPYIPNCAIHIPPSK